MKIRIRIIEVAATAGYLGRLPKAPGTFGAAGGLLIYLLMPDVPDIFVFGGVIGFMAFSIWIAGEAEKLFCVKDPAWIVIDEVAGMWVALFGHPRIWWVGIAGFLLFRLFDIFKPFPIGWIETKCRGGFGVVADDVIAGLMSNFVLHMILALIH